MKRDRRSNNICTEGHRPSVLHTKCVEEYLSNFFRLSGDRALVLDSGGGAIDDEFTACVRNVTHRLHISAIVKTFEKHIKRLAAPVQFEEESIATVPGKALAIDSFLVDAMDELDAATLSSSFVSVSLFAIIKIKFAYDGRNNGIFLSLFSQIEQ